MATAILLPPLYTGDPILDGTWVSLTPYTTPGAAVVVGGVDVGGAFRIPDDGYTLDAIDPNNITLSGLIRFADVGAIPLAAAINSVQVVCEVSVTDIQLNGDAGWGFQQLGIPYDGTTFDHIDVVGWEGPFPTLTNGSATFMSAVMPVIPATGLPWTYADLYGQTTVIATGWDPSSMTGQYFTNSRGWWILQMRGIGNPGAAASINYIALIVDYTGSAPRNVSIVGTGGVQAAGKVRTIGSQHFYLQNIAAFLSGQGGNLGSASRASGTASASGFGAAGIGGIALPAVPPGSTGGTLIRPGGAPPELSGIQWGLMRFDLKPRTEDTA